MREGFDMLTIMDFQHVRERSRVRSPLRSSMFLFVIGPSEALAFLERTKPYKAYEVQLLWKRHIRHVAYDYSTYLFSPSCLLDLHLRTFELRAYS